MRLPRDITGAELARALRKLGYEIDHQRGSHMRLTTGRNGEHHITIPAHDPIRVGTPNSKGIDVGSWLGTATFTQLRFRAGPSNAIAGRAPDEVSEFRWFGGRFDNNSPALDNISLPGAFNDLDWLTDPL